MSRHYPPESGKTRAALWISCSVFACPLLSRAEATLGTPQSYPLLVVGGCQAQQPQLSGTVHDRNPGRHGEALEKSPPVRDARQLHIASLSLGLYKQAPIYSDPSL
jgi:hypothetical protein